MAYLAKSDYTISIAVDHLDEILEQAAETSGLTSDNVRTNAETWAKAFIKSYLTAKYNITTEFALSTPSADRNPIIMQVMVDLVLCQVHKTINPRDIPELRAQACTDAVQWLKDARDGTVIVDLPPAPAPEGIVNFQNTYLSSQPKFISKPFQDGQLFDSTLNQP